MSGAEDAFVQLDTDGAGKRIKNYLVRGAIQSDGTQADVYIQCTSIQDADGRAVDFDDMASILRDIHKELRWIRKAFGEMTDNAQATLGLDDGSDDRDEVGF